MREPGRVGSAPDHVAFYARTQPHRLALADLPSGRRWSYAALHDAVRRCVSVLRDTRRIAPGERLAVLAKNCAELAILHLACARCGIVFVPLNWRLAPAELAVPVADCTPRLLIHDDVHADAAAGLPVSRLSVRQVWTEIEAAAPVARSTPGAADAPSVLLYTSGTSGRPKGVIITETMIYHSACNLAVLGQIDCNSVFICDGPLFHVIGLLTSLRSPLTFGGAALMSDTFDAGRTLERFADPELAVTHYFCVPQMAMMLRDHPDFAPENLRGLKALFTGGAPNPAADIAWWLDHGIAMVNGFGMTETGSTMGMSLLPQVIRAKADSVGLPAPTVEMRIASDAGAALAAGETGELWLKGPNITPGYWQRPDENEKAFTQDGWFKTGDLARMDEEGFVFIVDRKKDMYISGGENVYPGEVEVVLLQHPAVADASVVGIADARWGEVGRAYLVARPGGPRPDDQEVIAFCNARLARYKIPKSFVWVDALPRTGSGKIQKQKLRDGTATTRA